MLSKLPRRRGQKGFTLIEILIVVVIVAILAAIAVPIYLEYVRSARASDAKTSISAIHQASQVFYQDKDAWPSTVEELEQENYLELADATKLQWTFTITGSPPTAITATSTDAMRGGAGKTVTLDIREGKWTGYGLPQDEGEE